MTPESAAISVERVTKVYPVPLLRLRRLLRRGGGQPVAAVTDVSFRVAQGEVFGLIGRNGAGKTTLLKMIATLVRPTSGAVRVAGHDAVREESRVRALVGLAAAEERSFYWRLTANQNLMFFARLYGMSDGEARHRIGELSERLDLTGAARRRFGELSTGNKQRLAIARALLARPPVLLLDEPTRSLDPVAARSMREFISELTAGGNGTGGRATSVLLTSHNLAEIEELCPRVGVIAGGRLRALGTPADLRREHPQQERVRLVVRGSDHSALCAELSAALRSESVARQTAADLEFTIDNADGSAIVIFTRDAPDDRLDRALRTIHRHAGRVVSCDTERATLLDVLDAYEADEKAKISE